MGEENTNTKLIYIGEMKKRGQEYEIKQTINLLEVLEDSYTFNELHGMIIEPDNHKAAVSFWKEEYVIKCGTEYKVEAKEIKEKKNILPQIYSSGCDIREISGEEMVIKEVTPNEIYSLPRHWHRGYWCKKIM